MSDESRTRAIWLALAGTIGLLAVANLVVLPQSGAAAPMLVISCGACHGGLMVALPQP
jgi:hypothetical protein